MEPTAVPEVISLQANENWLNGLLPGPRDRWGDEAALRRHSCAQDSCCRASVWSSLVDDRLPVSIPVFGVETDRRKSRCNLNPG